MSELASTFLKMLPFVLAGVFLPTWTSNVIMLLGTNRPVANSQSFIGANALYRFAIGLAALYLLSADDILSAFEVFPHIPLWAFLALAALLIIPGLILVLRRQNHPQAEELPRWIGTLESFPPWGSFVWGLLSVASPGEQYIVLLGAVGVISAARLPAYQSIGLLAVAALGYQVMLEVPVGIYLWQRERADAAFESIKRWLGRYGGQVAGGILIGAGAIVALFGFLR